MLIECKIGIVIIHICASVKISDEKLIIIIEMGHVMIGISWFKTNIIDLIIQQEQTV